MASLDDVNVEDLIARYSPVEGELEEVTSEFYKELFNLFPNINALFKDVEVEQQKAKMASGLRLIMSTLHKSDDLVSALKEMSKRNEGYGATADLYPPVAETLIDIMQVIGEDDWTNAMSRAWDTVFNIRAEVMLSAYQEDTTDSDANSDRAPPSYGLKSNIQHEHITI